MSPARQSGVALVMVLWLVSLLTIMAASFSLSTQRNTGLVKTAQDRARALALADAGIHYALLMLSLPDPNKRWRSDGTFYEAMLPGGRVGIAIFDESGKIDINAASEQTLRFVLGKLTGDDETAASLADKIMDWRDSDDLKRVNGAEAKDYLAEGKAYVPQNKNFQAVEELQMVLGMTPALYKMLEPLLTMYTGQDGINPQKSSAAVLRQLFGMDEQSIAEFMELRRNSPPNAPVALPNVATGGIRMAAGGDTAYTIYAESLTEEGHRTGLKAIAKRQFSRSSGAPFAFVSWKQETVASPPDFQSPPPFPQ